jgi:hypothetical protein
MCGWVLLSKVCFDFHDARGEQRAARFHIFRASPFLAYKYFAQEFTRHAAWVAAEEGSVERTDRRPPR